MYTELVYPPEDGHPSQYYNRAQRRVTLFMRRTTLPLGYTKPPTSVFRQQVLTTEFFISDIRLTLIVVQDAKILECY